MPDHTLIGRTFGSLTQGEREGLPCGTVLVGTNSRFPWGERFERMPEWWGVRRDFTRWLDSELPGDAVIESIPSSVPTTPDPDEAKAREAEGPLLVCSNCGRARGDHFEHLGEPAYMRQAHDDGREEPDRCGEWMPIDEAEEAEIHLLVNGWRLRGAEDGYDFADLRQRIAGLLKRATGRRLLDAERALVAGVRREERAAPTPETLASPLLRHRDVLTTRTLSTLINRGINTVGELAALPDGYGTAKQPGILRLAGIGRKSRNECGELLRSLGLTWGHGAIDSGAHVLPEDAP